ncbi:hypothetical protein Ahy_A06g028241 [Arachis hypogaea]|uniref:Uncharacterized protein n=1 Tax=Arachis hypogaea TaxID=3818 RepID=A0A445CQQ1_ARAHY|nr:hypothetical protein Ahy_A06g028241 [Arachis hypogaea]
MDTPLKTIDFVCEGNSKFSRERSCRAIFLVVRSKPTSTVELCVGELLVRKVLLDLGSSAGVLFYSTYQKVNLNNKALQPSTNKFVGFIGELAPNTWLCLAIKNSRRPYIQYLVVDLLLMLLDLLFLLTTFVFGSMCRII